MGRNRAVESMAMTALLVARPEKQEELLQALKPLAEEARAQPGCLQCLAAQDLEGRARFLLYLCWKDRDGLNRYAASRGFQILLGASSILLAEPASFRFFGADAGPVLARRQP